LGSREDLLQDAFGDGSCLDFVCTFGRRDNVFRKLLVRCHYEDAYVCVLFLEDVVMFLGRCCGTILILGR